MKFRPCQGLFGMQWDKFFHRRERRVRRENDKNYAVTAYSAAKLRNNPTKHQKTIFFTLLPFCQRQNFVFIFVNLHQFSIAHL
jgi:hypothetical protein